MTPYLVTGPASLPVTLMDMKLHLRIDHDDDDFRVVALQKGVVADLDAHGGILGRCIMPQTWAVDVFGPGPHLLPFPDASDVTAVTDGTPLSVEVSRTSLGQCVTVANAVSNQSVTIEAVYGLTSERLPAAQELIKLMVSREYDALSGPAYDAATRSIDARIGLLRWRRA